MQTKLTLKPGQNGTKKWLKRFADKLVCVRYRYDKNEKKRYTTIEIIVDESTWLARDPIAYPAHSPSDLLGIRVAGYEQDMRKKVKDAGGIWRSKQKLWELSYRQITALGLVNRIVEPDD